MRERNFLIGKADGTRMWACAQLDGYSRNIGGALC